MATSAGLGVPITVVGTVGYIIAGLPHRALLPPLSLGFVSLVAFVLMAPVSSFVAPMELASRIYYRNDNLKSDWALFCCLLRFGLSSA